MYVNVSTVHCKATMDNDKYYKWRNKSMIKRLCGTVGGL